MEDKSCQTPPGRFIPDPPSENEDEPQLQPEPQQQTRSKKRSIGTAEAEEPPQGEEPKVVVQKPLNKRRKQEAEQGEEIETENENEDQEDWKLKVVSPGFLHPLATLYETNIESSTLASHQTSSIPLSSTSKKVKSREETNISQLSLSESS
jgi:hypothetical protein